MTRITPHSSGLHQTQSADPKPYLGQGGDRHRWLVGMLEGLPYRPRPEYERPLTNPASPILNVVREDLGTTSNLKDYVYRLGEWCGEFAGHLDGDALVRALDGWACDWVPDEEGRYDQGGDWVEREPGGRGRHDAATRHAYEVLHRMHGQARLYLAAIEQENAG